MAGTANGVRAEGPVAPVRHFAPYKMLRETMDAAKIKQWVNNGLRHSFASYHLAKWNNAGLLALEMGHTTNELIFAHYRALVHESEAEKYWAVFPAGSMETATVVNFKGSPPSPRPAPPAIPPRKTPAPN